MDSVQDILLYATTGDRESFKSAVDDALMNKAVDAVNLMRNDVAASMFSATTGGEEQPSDEYTTDDQLSDSAEDPTDEDV
jgi:hypothetical protein